MCSCICNKSNAFISWFFFFHFFFFNALERYLKIIWNDDWEENEIFYGFARFFEFNQNTKMGILDTRENLANLKSTWTNINFWRKSVPSLNSLKIPKRIVWRGHCQLMLRQKISLNLKCLCFLNLPYIRLLS